VTGDYSRGAAGIWIQDGELAFPVSEVTVASTLQEIFAGIVGIGNDLRFRGSMESPTLMIREMTVGGR
jgi:PmbA protein